MSKPETYKDIEVNGRSFRLNKMDARTGSYMLFKLVKILAPIFKNIDLKDVQEEAKEDSSFFDDINLTDLMEPLFSLPEDEFRYIQDNCLRSVQEILSARNPYVLDKYGEYGVLDIEFDTALVMQLTIQSLVFNVSGFFEGGLLGSLVKGSNISQQNSAM